MIRVFLDAIRTGIQTSKLGYATPPHSHPYAEIFLLSSKGAVRLGSTVKKG